jgi:hypothetical protein
MLVVVLPHSWPVAETKIFLVTVRSFLFGGAVGEIDDKVLRAIIGHDSGAFKRLISVVWFLNLFHVWRNPGPFPIGRWVYGLTTVDSLRYIAPKIAVCMKIYGFL